MKKQLFLTTITLLFSLFTFGQTFTFGGINYVITSPTTVRVGTNTYFTGAANIPSALSYNGNNYLVNEIEDGAFLYCTGLTSVTIPYSVKKIGYEAFKSCYNITSINIPNSVTYLGEGVFEDCTKLRSAIISDSVSRLSKNTFSRCISLTSIILPNSLTYIGNSAFNGCTSLAAITIPDSVNDIMYFAFSGCTNLVTVNFPDNALYLIWDYAFSGCTKLQTIKLPTTLNFISEGMFENCTSLTSIQIQNSYRRTSIGYRSFKNCTSLKTIEIPDSINQIAREAFANCTALTSVKVRQRYPIRIDTSVFSGLNLPNIVLYVPTGTIPTYDSTPVWTDFMILESTSVTKNNSSVSNNLNIYPNPASNFIAIKNIENFTENFGYKVIDMIGRVVKSGKLEATNQINIEQLSNGNYTLLVENKKGERFSGKIVKQ